MAAHKPIPEENIERTEALLFGSMLLYLERVTSIRAMLQPEDFSEDRHRLIYETLLTVMGTSERDIVQAMSILLTQDELERIGGVPYLSLLKQQAESKAIPVQEQAYQLKHTILNPLLTPLN